MACQFVLPAHSFHIPVMGTGFTIDTPLKVARYGISSVISVVDDVLIEQMRRRLSEIHGRACEPIEDGDEDSRARRITAYLDLLDDLVREQVEKLRASVFARGSEIVRYYEMLPPSPLKTLYLDMQAAEDPDRKAEMQQELRRRIEPGSIDVNIMTKVDRDRVRKGVPLPARFSDALSALRGFMNSRVRSSIVLSAGMNRRLFSYMAEFNDFFPDQDGAIKKRIVLKVSDYRSALIQGKLLARLGLAVSEFRVESGLNCGGHAFGGKGKVLGPILAEFQRERERLAEGLQEIRQKALSALGRKCSSDLEPARITVQGGIGTAQEDGMLRGEYGVDGTGWGSPFLLVPEAVNLDAEHRAKIAAAGEDDISLSGASPLGVPFWLLRTSSSETARCDRITDGKPGSPCPKGFLVSNTEFSKAPICTASRAYQKRKLREIEASDLSDDEKFDQVEEVLARACICHDLAGSATRPYGIDPGADTAVCCGPNVAYFSRDAGLDEMLDHIYGRASLPVDDSRPHMFLKELSLHIDRLKKDIERRGRGLHAPSLKSTAEVKENLRNGIEHYRERARRILADKQAGFLQRLEAMNAELERILPESVITG